MHTGGVRLRRVPVRETVRFALTIALCSVISSSIGELALWSLGILRPAELFFAWVTWWVGDVTGTLVVAPPGERHWHGAAAAEAAAVLSLAWGTTDWEEVLPEP